MDPDSYGEGMKRYVLFASLTVTAFMAAGPLQAQNSLVALAERQQWDERFQMMSARVEKLEEAIQLYQQRINTLTAEIHSLREQLAGANGGNSVNAATQKSMELLADAIKEVDRKRMADNEKILKALDDLKGSVHTPSIIRHTASSSARPSKEKGWEYTVESGDNSLVIAEKLKKNGINVSASQIVDANPGVVWNRLKIGQKIFIPAP